MNLHLAQISSLPFHIDALRHVGQAGTQNDAAGMLGVDTSRSVVTHPLGRRLARLIAWLSDLPHRARERDEMAHLTERDLADMGLTSGDVSRLHDPAFAADHAMSRSVRTSLTWL